MKIDAKKLIIAAGVLVIVVVGVMLLMAMTKQPSTADYKSLDLERQVIDTSINIYGPVFSQYTKDYINAYSEDRPADEKATLKARYENSLEKERMVNTDRLERMESSVALRESNVKKSFESFRDKYGAIIKYYDQYSTNLSAITESVSGPCAKLAKLNVSVKSFSSDYTKAADVCLKALETAKEGTDKSTTKLLNDVEKLIKERRDKFDAVQGKEAGSDQDLARAEALAGLLDINDDLKVIQSEYETVTKTENTKLLNEANESNASLDKALNGLITPVKPGRKEA